ncbi:MAG TPA: DUF3987 domain-containing protein [Nitrospiraceae bacterium]|nr:DUF3987 domain-containing protein [Nitrospiraceae bacterium]
MAKVKQLSEQIELLLRHLRGRSPSDAGDESLNIILDFVRDVPPAARPPELVSLVRSVFKLDDKTLELRLSPKAKIPEFDALVPQQGWLADYIEYTRNTEPPTVFHFFAGLVAVGTSMQRNVYVNKGPYNIFPNVCAVLVAPSGKCRKTSACNISVDMVRSAGGSVVSDKATPEALVEAFRESTSACGLLYAPELAVFLGKQKYQEGMIPMLTSLFDAPKEWSSLTIGRGELKLTNVAFSFLGASTLDWMQTAIPRDAFGGGFMSRILFVVQEDTPRSFPIPPPVDAVLKGKLQKQLIQLTKARGQVPFYEGNPEARSWYEDWYTNKRGAGNEEKQFAGYSERKPDHLVRIAMILAAAEGDPLKMNVPHLQQALRILDWLEHFLPATFEQMTQSGIGEDHQRMLKQLRNHGGTLEHSKWLRLNSAKMDSRMFRERTDTMRQAKLIDFDNKTRTYFLTPEGWR